MILAAALWLALAQDTRALLVEIEGFDTRLAAIGAQVDSLEGRSVTLHAEEAAHRAELATADAKLAEMRAGTVQRVRAFYRLKRRGMARLLFDAQSPLELRRRIRYLLAILRADDARTRTFSSLVEGRRVAAEKVAADARVIDQLRADLTTQRDALQKEREARLALVRDVRTQPVLAGRLVQEKAQAAATLGASLRAVEATAPASTGGGDADFRAAKGRLPSPVEGRVARGYGAYTDPASGAAASNLGVDYVASFGAPFRAVADGVVTRAGYVRGYGQVVVVQHGSYTTLYAHANGLRVAQGQAVQRGDVLGLVGNTGLADDAEARLHFEIRYNGTPQDPAGWLGR